MKLVQKLKVPEFQEIQNELREEARRLVKIRERDSMIGPEEPFSYLVDIHGFLSLRKFLNFRKLQPIASIHIGVTPPGVFWDIHKDGYENDCVQVSINIPIEHYEDSRNLWFDLPNKLGKPGPGIYKPKILKIDRQERNINWKNYKIIENVCVDQISLMRNDVFHSVINYSETHTRTNAIIRFKHPLDGTKLTFEDCFKFDDLV